MTTRTLTLAKGGRKYLFRYSSGCEGQIVDEIVRLAEDADTPLDWMDAAMLSFQVTQYAAEECAEAMGIAPQRHDGADD